MIATSYNNFVMKKHVYLFVLAIVLLSAGSCQKKKSYQCQCLVKLTQTMEYNVIEDESASSAKSKCEAQTKTGVIDAKSCELAQ